MTEEHKAPLPTQPSLGLLPEYSSPTQKVPWHFIGCQLGAALCCMVAAYRAFHMQPGLGWGLGAGALMLLGYVVRKLED
ncbi:hypothetical protein [Inhella proteolytica]|uniref:Uncharacterized protein n=1 Tax=Inhella proteolytica TaxID=2795029 RepID=A0A931J614_9BURK|nr:hypothetical protein [Inhella proteolytica]MBH9578860.1 hypothetical protein [Inhella proteolytica]